MPWISAVAIGRLEAGPGHYPVGDSLAFTIFVAIFCGGLVALTIAMVWIAAVLVRRHRKKL